MPTLARTFSDTVEEGTARLHRSWPSLLATGTVGGIDVSLGVLAAFLVKHGTGNDVLSALAFSIGFIALTLANSELFTENFLVPLSAVAAKKARPRAIGRLWLGTSVTNLVGGVAMVLIFLVVYPELAPTAVEKGSNYMELEWGLQSFLSAVLAGIVITLMTWMQHGDIGTGGKIVAAVLAGFLLSYGHLSHLIVASLETIAAIRGGAPFSYGEWAGRFFLWALGNAVGGIGLVTVLRLLQVGPQQVRREQEKDLDDPETRDQVEDAEEREREKEEDAETAEA